MGNFSPSLGQLGAELGEHGSVLLPRRRDRVAHRLLECGHDVGLVLDESHLEVHLREFGEVTGRCALFRAEDLGDSEDALEGADHDLLIELRRGREIRRLVIKIVDFEYGGSAFGVAADERRRLELGKALLLERLAIGIDDGRLHGEDIAIAFAPQRERAIVEGRIEIHLLIFGERKYLSGSREPRYFLSRVR